MFGLPDPWIWSAYLLCILSALLCVIYGLMNWNKGEEPTTPDDQQWMEEERKIDEEF